MPGVVFLICVPTENYEKNLSNGNNFDNNEFPLQTTNDNINNNKTLNINQLENININNNNNNNNVDSTGISSVGNAVLRLEVELRDKNARPCRFQSSPMSRLQQNKFTPNTTDEILNNCRIPLEKVLDELLKKLNIDNVIWNCDKKLEYYQVIFPIQSGEPCETTLHCLTELGIGSKYNSTISVMPCSVSYDGTVAKDNSNEEMYSDAEEFSKWNNFVESIKSKLTVKQVVDGVRAGGALSFDYLLLIVTADSLAALGLVENNAPNIVAAMLVSPLMGPVMSITFGAIISDRELMKVGFISLGLGIFISILFGFIFGLILGTTDMPWGFGDWPTEEMKGRGNARSLWMGVLWALTSGTGVAVALLQGSAGPLIGVAISASLLPPVVNCGLFWALACIWLIYDGTKIPHLKGESYTGNSSYVPLYTNYLPTEFLINGIVSALLTVVNVICIFITAIIVLKIKEVAAPYTSSPDLRRFWETDIRTVRKTNRSTIRRNNGKISQNQELYNPVQSKNLENALEQALREAVDDETLRKVKRMSYSSNAADELQHRIPMLGNNNTGNSQGSSSIRNSMNFNKKLKTDLAALDKLVTSLLEQHSKNQSSSTVSPSSSTTPSHRNSTSIFDRLKSNSLRNYQGNRRNTNTTSNFDYGILAMPHDQQQQQQQASTTMPTILETTNNNINNNNNSSRTTSWSEKNINPIRRVVNSIVNSTIPQQFSQNNNEQLNEERINLTQNILD